MEILPFLAVVGLVHAALYFTDQFLKSCMNVPYIYFLENVGLWVKPLQLHWFTTAFNRTVTKWALWRPRFFRAWFSVGAVVVLLLLLPSLFLLVSGLANHLRPSQVQTVATLQPMVPGLNIPTQELPYYFFTLLLASIIHEAGHAFAAVQEDVRVNGFGFLLMFILPGAYVDVPTEEIRALTPFRQLKILCAGVWHNVVLVGVAVGLGVSAPHLLQPLYHQGKGLSVIAMTQDSPARGVTGLEVGDVITAVNRAAVNSVGEWRAALTATVTQEQAGFCVPEGVVHDHDETVQHAFEGVDGSVQCCEGDSEAHLCFELLENREVDVGVASMHPFSCLPARLAISRSAASCVTSATCPEDTHCLAPSLKNTTRLVQISRGVRETNDGGGGSKIEGEQEDVLYLGPPAYLYHTVTVTSYVPKYRFLPASWPNALEIYCDYMVKFSGALAVLNMVPVLYLDGYWIYGAVIDLVLAGRCDHVTRKVVHVVTTLVGSVLLFGNIALGVWSML